MNMIYCGRYFMIFNVQTVPQNTLFSINLDEGVKVVSKFNPHQVLRFNTLNRASGNLLPHVTKIKIMSATVQNTSLIYFGTLFR